MSSRSRHLYRKLVGFAGSAVGYDGTPKRQLRRLYRNSIDDLLAKQPTTDECSLRVQRTIKLLHAAAERERVPGLTIKNLCQLYHHLRPNHVAQMTRRKRGLHRSYIAIPPDLSVPHGTAKLSAEPSKLLLSEHKSRALYALAELVEMAEGSQTILLGRLPPKPALE
ncbi:uncharacterized protein L969DRAFT_105643 [Mixia osmundae IAM 14324]|uniref:Uncharacterized protein n=1 Tax=Mixia osmundae (strain CBS 9802 / IAM 14324 / JCM 22182 / KY 12970) TaxID=764103 RepID=G7E2M9_MIXOS|nr:uncharacterized protein L969DRAFT_105643 [Mixia osmundae IAM 14324]KEI36954.1 hypothetical protein L969DRAFT_105643 [Mixia osmundae IAM 14324]GAA97089.1 hypothetical protein E5Q_03764 [Mixia osmundae IAM 14324]